MLRKFGPWFLSILFCMVMLTSSARAGGTVDTALNISIPCVNVLGSYFQVELENFDHPSDASGLYWKLGPGATLTTDDGDCATLDTSLNITLNNLDVLGSLYNVTLTYVSCPQLPNDLIWTLGSAAPVSSGGSFTLTTQAFTVGGEIPLTYVCTSQGGSNVSPDLSWSNAPSATQSFALVMDDEVSPCGTGDDACMHWSVYNIPVSESGLAQDIDVSSISGATEGENYTGSTGYAGPCPPNPHTYTFTLYALSGSMPAIPSGTPMTRSMFSASFASYILDSVTITGTFTP